MNRQFVSVKFNPADRRAYTYHHDGEPLAVGDRVHVPNSRGGDKPSVVEVVDIWDRAPEFATKAVIGKAPPAEEKLI